MSSGDQIVASRSSHARTDLPPHRVVKEGGLLFCAHGGRAVFLLALMTVASHTLTPEKFGAFSFLQSFFLWLAMLGEAGIAVAAARVLSQQAPGQFSETLSGFALVFGVWSVFLAFVVALLAQPIAQAFQLPIRQSLLICAVPAIGVLWLGALREILPALGSIGTLAAAEVFPPLIALGGVLILSLTTPTLEAVALCYTGAFFLVTLAVWVRLGRGLSLAKAAWRRLLDERTRFGNSIYVGRLVGTGGFMIDIPVLALYASDASLVGQYALLKGLAAPVALIGQAVATSQFRDLSRSSRIANSVVIATAVASALGAMGLGLLGPLFVGWVLPAPYSVITPLLPLWAVTAFLQSGYQLPNTYLRAHGQGRDLRSLAFLFGGVSAVLQLMLTPRLGILGASLAAFGSVAVWTVGAWWIYLRERDDDSSRAI